MAESWYVICDDCQCAFPETEVTERIYSVRCYECHLRHMSWINSEWRQREIERCFDVGD